MKAAIAVVDFVPAAATHMSHPSARNLSWDSEGISAMGWGDPCGVVHIQVRSVDFRSQLWKEMGLIHFRRTFTPAPLFVLPFLTILLHFLKPVSAFWLLILLSFTCGFFPLPDLLSETRPLACVLPPPPTSPSLASFSLTCSRFFSLFLPCFVHCLRIPGSLPCLFHFLPILFWALVPVLLLCGPHVCAPAARLPCCLPSPPHHGWHREDGLPQLLSRSWTCSRGQTCSSLGSRGN